MSCFFTLLVTNVADGRHFWTIWRLGSATEEPKAGNTLQRGAELVLGGKSEIRTFWENFGFR